MIVLGELVLRARAATDAEVRGRLRRLIDCAPVTWPACWKWWRRVRDVLGDLHAEGRLPEPFPPPEEDRG
jgi:hypothetical protein